MAVSTIVLILLVVLIIFALPTWGYSRTWSYGPSGIIGVLVAVLLILLLLGKI